MIYTISIISSFLSGMGVGGGSIFVLLAIMLKIGDLDEIRVYNLAMFVTLGLFLAIKNKNELNKQKSNIIKMIFFIIVGSFLGTKIGKIVSQEKTIILFNALMLALGIYEIIVSLKHKNNEQNITKKGEK